MAEIIKDSIVIELDIRGKEKLTDIEGALNKLEQKSTSAKGKVSKTTKSVIFVK